MEAPQTIKFTSQNTILLVGAKSFKICGAEYQKTEETLDKRAASLKISLLLTCRFSGKADATITQNIVMIGLLSARTCAWRELVPAKYLNINTRAFELV